MIQQSSGQELYLGKTGVSVTRLTLGTANFGSYWGNHWTLEQPHAKRLVAQAYEGGIKSFDTANVYNNGESEIWLGKILSDLGLNSKVTVSTKFGYLTNPKEPKSGGSGRVAMKRAIEISLKRLRLETVDILYLHLWDKKTPIEETLEAASKLLESGKIRAFALSNTPSWYLARAALLCGKTGLPGLAAIQLNYNLLTRHLESDFNDILRISKIDMIAWGPLANGLLSGRYRFDNETGRLFGSGRITNAAFTTGSVDTSDSKVISMVNEICRISQDTNLSPAQISLAWLIFGEQPKSVVIGVSNEVQLRELLVATERKLDVSIVNHLNTATKPTVRYPLDFLEPDIQVLVHGNSK